MPARIRLQRYGKKGKPFYHIVIADGRAPRDGKYIENIGTYNPLTTPATIILDIDKAMQWLKNGAAPSDTVKAILSYKGVLYKYHLLKGVAKGALTAEQAEAKFNAWSTEKEERIVSKIKAKEISKKDAKKKAISKEIEVNEAREKEQMAKLAKMAEKEARKEAQEEEVAEVEVPEAEALTEAPEAVAIAETPEVIAVAETPEVEAIAETPEVTETPEIAPEN